MAIQHENSKYFNKNISYFRINWQIASAFGPLNCSTTFAEEA
jgi:hypothetical protein